MEMSNRDIQMRLYTLHCAAVALITFNHFCAAYTASDDDIDDDVDDCVATYSISNTNSKS